MQQNRKYTYKVKKHKITIKVKIMKNSEKLIKLKEKGKDQTDIFMML